MVAQAAAAGQGAKGVQIVDKGWLYASFSKWERAPEGPYRIVVDDEPLDAPIADVGDGDKPARPAGLVIKVEALDELEDKEMLDGLASPIEEIVADIGGETGEKWDDWDAELEEFLLEEDTASEHDSAPATPPGIVVTEPEGEEDAAAAGRNKRKREPADVEGETPPDSAAVAAPPAPVPAPESELQRRKKRAFERTSSLTQVANAAGPADDGMSAGEEAGGKKKVPNGKGVRDDDEGGDGYDAAAMEAEMLAAFEMDGEDDVKGDG
jgi:RNA polymerase II subunit A-like phosphatase